MRTNTALRVLLEATDKVCKPLEFDANLYELGHMSPAAFAAYRRRKRYREAYATIYYKVKGE